MKDFDQCCIFNLTKVTHRSDNLFLFLTLNHSYIVLFILSIAVVITHYFIEYGT